MMTACSLKLLLIEEVLLELMLLFLVHLNHPVFILHLLAIFLIFLTVILLLLLLLLKKLLLPLLLLLSDPQHQLLFLMMKLLLEHSILIVFFLLFLLSIFLLFILIVIIILLVVLLIMLLIDLSDVWASTTNSNQRLLRLLIRLWLRITGYYLNLLLFIIAHVLFILVLLDWLIRCSHHVMMMHLL